MEKLQPSHTVLENINGVTTVENWLAGFKNKTKLTIELPYDPKIPFLVLYPRDQSIWTTIFTQLFIVAYFTKAKEWKQSKRPWADEWTNEWLCIYRAEYYPAIKWSEVQVYGTLSTNLENSQRHESDTIVDRLYGFILYKIYRISKLIEIESQLLAVSCWGERGIGSNYLMGTGFPCGW